MPAAATTVGVARGIEIVRNNPALFAGAVATTDFGLPGLGNHRNGATDADIINWCKYIQTNNIPPPAAVNTPPANDVNARLRDQALRLVTDTPRAAPFTDLGHRRHRPAD
jgi:hypothetical protein